jgi:hypothetical protein
LHKTEPVKSHPSPVELHPQHLPLPQQLLQLQPLPHHHLPVLSLLLVAWLPVLDPLVVMALALALASVALLHSPMLLFKVVVPMVAFPVSKINLSSASRF